MTVRNSHIYSMGNYAIWEGEPHREPTGQRKTLYAAHERQDGIISSLYDFGPRDLSAALLTWNAPDKYASKYSHFGAYVANGANPVKYTDFSGNKIGGGIL